MNIIIPMAGQGKRLRPHTLTRPKPLFPLVGKPIVQHLVEYLGSLCEAQVETIAFVTSELDAKNNQNLIAIAESVGAKAELYVQEEALGTAHAIHYAKSCLTGEVLIAFADTLFRTDFKPSAAKDGVIWVKQVADPRQYGVVTLNDNGYINGMVEKPTDFVSNQAIIGIYYCKQGDLLLDLINHLLDNDIRSKGEYQLTDALQMMVQQGCEFLPGAVNQWMDCGSKDLLISTNQVLLDEQENASLVHESAKIIDSIIIPPCSIGPDVTLHQSVVGPYVSIGAQTTVYRSNIQNSILLEKVSVKGGWIKDSIIGESAQVSSPANQYNIGDYTNLSTDPRSITD
jgi:glucose-1-phosphate thymidylyltransferase